MAVAPLVVLGAPGEQLHSLHSVAIGPGHEQAGSAESARSAGPNGDSVSGAATLTLHVHLYGPAALLLMREFAKPIVLPLASADAALVQAVQLLRSELAAPRCGQPAMLASAGHMLFIGLLRHLVAHPGDNQGLFASLNDPRIAVSLVAMHEHPQNAWTLESLAACAGMSRTAFATRFKDSMRIPPGKYLAQLRLLIAQRAVQSGKGLKSAARESDYQNVSALSRALGRARLS